MVDVGAIQSSKIYGKAQVASNYLKMGKDVAETLKKLLDTDWILDQVKTVVGDVANDVVGGGVTGDITANISQATGDITGEISKISSDVTNKANQLAGGVVGDVTGTMSQISNDILGKVPPIPKIELKSIESILIEKFVVL